MKTSEEFDETCEICEQPFTKDDLFNRHTYHPVLNCPGRDVIDPDLDACTCYELYDVHEACCPQCNPAAPPEKNRERRGHAFYPPASVLAAVPGVRSESVALADKVLHLHFFVGGCDWWVAEYDAGANEAWGYACLNDPQNAEWGYFSLTELEELFIEGTRFLLPDGSVAFRAPVVVERDLQWVPRRVAETQLPGVAG